MYKFHPSLLDFPQLVASSLRTQQIGLTVLYLLLSLLLLSFLGEH